MPPAAEGAVAAGNGEKDVSVMHEAIRALLDAGGLHSAGRAR